MNMMIEPIHLTVKSHPRSLRQIRDLMTEITCQMSVPDKEAANIILALDEACSNIIRHGYKNKADKDIHIAISTADKNMTIQITDCGICFDLTKATPRDPGDLRPGGLGIFIIKQVMDRVEYRKTAEGLNQTKLIKHLHRD